MQKHHRFTLLASLAAVVVLAGGGLAAWYRLQPRLPAPERADREALVRWLVTCDLSKQPASTRRALARRLEEEFRGNVDWAATGRQLTVDQRRQLWANVPWLLEPWLVDKMKGYFGTPNGQRPAYVDRVIDTIAAWRGVETLQPQPANRQQPASLLTLLAQRLDAMKAHFPATQRKEMSQFLLAVESRWFFRSLGGKTPGVR